MAVDLLAKEGILRMNVNFGGCEGYHVIQTIGNHYSGS